MRQGASSVVNQSQSIAISGVSKWCPGCDVSCPVLAFKEKPKRKHQRRPIRPEDIVQILAERLVHNETGRQLTPLAVESALKNIGFSVPFGTTANETAGNGCDSLFSVCRAQPRVAQRQTTTLMAIHLKTHQHSATAL